MNLTDSLQYQPQVLIGQDELKAALSRLAAEIRKDYQGKNPLLIGVLKGSFVFLADLIRSLNMPLEVDFIKLSSYGQGMESSGKVRIVQGLNSRLKGRALLVVEDIVDTGITLSFLLNYLKSKKPAQLRLCALLDKPSRRQVPVTIDYLGFTVPNKFIVGYGIDWNERFRYLPDVCYVEDEK